MSRAIAKTEALPANDERPASRADAIGVPLAHDVMYWMAPHDYRACEIVDLSRRLGVMVQFDAIFVPPSLEGLRWKPTTALVSE